MKDLAFLCWLHDRLVHVHGENPNNDYMWKLRSIMADIPPTQETPNTTQFKIEDLKKAAGVE